MCPVPTKLLTQSREQAARPPSFQPSGTWLWQAPYELPHGRAGARTELVIQGSLSGREWHVSSARQRPDPPAFVLCTSDWSSSVVAPNRWAARWPSETGLAAHTPMPPTKQAVGASTHRRRAQAPRRHLLPCRARRRVSPSAACRLYRAACDPTQVAQSPGACPPHDGTRGTARLARLPRIGWDRWQTASLGTQRRKGGAPVVAGASTTRAGRAQAHRLPIGSAGGASTFPPTARASTRQPAPHPPKRPSSCLARPLRPWFTPPTPRSVGRRWARPSRCYSTALCTQSVRLRR